MKRFREEDELNLVDPFGSGAPIPVADPALPVAPVTDAAGNVTFPGETVASPTDVVPPAPDAVPDTSLVDPTAILPDGSAVSEDEILEPILYEDDEDFSAIAPELGDFPADPTVTPEPPVIMDDTDVEDDIYSSDDLLESKEFVAKVSFHLPENRKVVISKGDTLRFVGKAKQGLPKFAESTFNRAVSRLTEGKTGTLITEGAQEEKVAVIGRSCLFEVARAWHLPGTNIVLEEGDIYQVISAKPIREAEDKEDDKNDKGDGDGDGTDDKDGDGKDGDGKDDADKKDEKCGKGKKKEAVVLGRGSRLNESRRGVTFGVADQY